MVYTLETRLLGMAEGNFRGGADANGQGFADHVRKALARHLPHGVTILAPKVNFTNRVVCDYPEEREHWIHRLFRTRHDADGVICRGTKAAAVIFHSDWPVVCLSEKDRFALLHAAYGNLIRPRPGEPGILEVAMGHFDRLHVEIRLAYGIGPCCWQPTHDEMLEVLQPKMSPNHGALLEECIGRTTRGPYGWSPVSVDLYQLAWLILTKVCQVPEERISWDTRCTCCALQHGQPLYWSHTRWRKAHQDGGTHAVDGQNAVLAYLVSPSDIPYM